MSGEASLENLVLNLKGMRAGLQQYETGDRATWPESKERWSVLLDRYDTSLVQVAALCGIPVPEPAGERRLNDEDRTHVENALRACGIEL